MNANDMKTRQALTDRLSVAARNYSNLTSPAHGKALDAVMFACLRFGMSPATMKEVTDAASAFTPASIR